MSEYKKLAFDLTQRIRGLGYEVGHDVEETDVMLFRQPLSIESMSPLVFVLDLTQRSWIFQRMRVIGVVFVENDGSEKLQFQAFGLDSVPIAEHIAQEIDQQDFGYKLAVCLRKTSWPSARIWPWRQRRVWHLPRPWYWVKLCTFGYMDFY